jgi:hypothetical protein
MKEIYTKPQTEVFDIQMTQQLLAGSDIITNITTGGDSGNIGIDFGGGGSGPGHSREFDDFDDLF